MAQLSVYFPMNGGDGQYSYARNSTLQRRGVEGVAGLVREAIDQKLDVKNLISSSSSSSSFNIVDLGCSVGPNTFLAVQNIIESIKLKCQSHSLNLDTIEFQVFFNDHSMNDFNTLFKSLPANRPYLAAGVPGSFFGRLFPRASIHFVFSSYALQWLPKISKELEDKKSPAWNKGKIFYANASKEVVEAYAAQFARGMGAFLSARAEEVVCGGLMALLIPFVPDGVPHSQCAVLGLFDLLGAALMDMVSMGLVSEDKVDSFNFPNYVPTPEELKTLIIKNNSFTIERMEPLPVSKTQDSPPTVETLLMTLRSGWEQVIEEQFGSEVIDELFNLLRKKIVESRIFTSSAPKNSVNLFVHLKRRQD